jgi:hypothetical protein
MKKAIFFMGFIGVSTICFSQANTLANNVPATGAIIKISDNNNVLRLVRSSEKIQITENGSVRFSKEYKPEYPAPMSAPDTQPIKNNTQIQNN